MLIRLDRFLADQNFGTRKHVKKLIKSKLITIDDKVCTDADFKFDPEKVKVFYNGELIEYHSEVYILLNKAEGYICSTIDELYPSVLNLIDESLRKRCKLVGRLDVDTTGVLLITDNGKLNNKLIHPNTAIEKEYHVKMNHDITETMLDILSGPIDLQEDGVVQAKKVEKIAKDEVSITIMEGKYHEIKRMAKRAGLEVVALDRVRLGKLTYQGIERGSYRMLNEEEVEDLKNITNLSEDK